MVEELGAAQLYAGLFADLARDLDRQDGVDTELRESLVEVDVRALHVQHPRHDVAHDVRCGTAGRAGRRRTVRLCVCCGA